MKSNKPNKKVVITMLALVVSLSIWFTAGIPAYFYALYLEGNWAKAEPKTKAELEKFLHLYSLHEIEPKNSYWGHQYILKKGEILMQYRLLWRKDTPLDVVYDVDNNIKSIFTSYE
jgi:hypothetical protein